VSRAAVQEDIPPVHPIVIPPADHPHIAVDQAQAQEAAHQAPLLRLRLRLLLLLQDHQGHQVLHPTHLVVHLAVLHPGEGDSLINNF